MTPEQRWSEIKQRINGILEDGGMRMHSSDVTDCVGGSVGFEMTDDEIAECKKEVRAITGRR